MPDRLEPPPPRGIPTAIDGGDWCIPVKFGVDARSESEAKSFAIDHNNLVLSESFDAETVAGIWNESYLDLLQSIAESNELPVTVSSADLELLLSLGFEGDVGDQEDEQETADLIDKAADPGYLGRVKSGEAWRLGRHFLLCGDSTIEENTRKLMSIAQIKSIDGCWTDPPYGVSYVGKTKESLKIQNDSLNAEQLHEFLVKAFKSVSAASGGNSIPVYVAHPAGELHNTFYQAIIESQLVFKQTLVWVKNSFAMGRSDYHYQHEPIYYCCTPGADRPSRMGNGPWYGDHSQSSVFSFSKPNANRLHPTMKPVDLIEAMLKNSIPQSGWVFDPFGGSGSTLIAAEQLGMRALTIELDPRFASVIIDRWELLTGKEAERVRSN